MLVSELETPAVVVDLEVMERNLSRMAEYCQRQGIKLRPHTKSHKIPELAKRQIESGAIGITVAKIGEAEVMLDSGITDILIAYPVVGRVKTTRLAELAERADITVSLDSVEAAQAISEQVTARNVKVGILAELDIFNDRNMEGIGVARVEDCALSVIVTVVISVASRAIVDGGSKTFSSDRYLAGDGRGFGLVKEDQEAEVENLSEEHGHLNI